MLQPAPGRRFPSNSPHPVWLLIGMAVLTVGVVAAAVGLTLQHAAAHQTDAFHFATRPQPVPPIAPCSSCPFGYGAAPSPPQPAPSSSSSHYENRVDSGPSRHLPTRSEPNIEQTRSRAYARFFMVPALRDHLESTTAFDSTIRRGNSRSRGEPQLHHLLGLSLVLAPVLDLDVGAVYR